MFGIISPGLHIRDLLHGRKAIVGQPHLVPLVDKRRPLKRKLHHRQQPGKRRVPGSVPRDLTDHTRIVMVVIKKGHPAVAAVMFHPVDHIVPEIIQIIGIVFHPHMSRRLQMIEGKHHIQLPAFFSRHQLTHLHAQPRRLTHRKCPVRCKGLLLQLPQILMQLRPVIIMLDPCIPHQSPDGLIALWQPFLFRDIIDHIHAEAVHAPVQPAVDHRSHFLPHPRIVPV